MYIVNDDKYVDHCPSAHIVVLLPASSEDDHEVVVTQQTLIAFHQDRRSFHPNHLAE